MFGIHRIVMSVRDGRDLAVVEVLIAGTKKDSRAFAATAAADEFLNVHLDLISKELHDFLVSTEASNVNSHVSSTVSEHDSALVEQLVDHASVVVVGSPVQGSHAHVGNFEVYIGTVLDQELNTIQTHFLGLLSTSLDKLSAKVTLLAACEQRCCAVGVLLVDVEVFAVTLFPLVDNEVQNLGISVTGSQVKRPVTIIILGIEDLLQIAL